MAVKRRRSFFDPQPERTQVWSCGGGTQSAAIAVLILKGALPKPDLCVMVDTERENSNVFPYLETYIAPAFREIGTAIHVVRKSQFSTMDVFGGKDGETILLPGFTDQTGKVGKLRNFCSGEWKRDVISRWLRSRGVEQCDTWIGFSLDEWDRISTDRVKWKRSLYPLIELGIKRAGCVQLVTDFGWPEPPRSSCKMCPNKSDAEWLDMRDNRPQDFTEAVAFERWAQQRDPHFWLHQSCVPLDQVVFDVLALPLFDNSGCVGGVCGV